MGEGVALTERGNVKVGKVIMDKGGGEGGDVDGDEGGDGRH